MSPTLTDLTIHTPFDGAEEKFAEAVRIREQHWAGRGGLGGDVKPTSGLNLHEVMMDRGGEICDRLMSEHGWSETDFRHAAGRLEATGDPDLRALAQHMRAFEMFASEQEQKEMAQMSNATESMMTRRLIDGQSEEYLREQRVRPGSVLDSREDRGRAWPRNNAGRVHEPQAGPRTTAPLGYPTQTRPIDDREARGALEPAMSDKLRSLAREVRNMAGLSSNVRQRNRLLARSSELQRMALTQYQREMENEVPSNDDESEPSNVLNRLVSDMDDEARAAGAQPDDSFKSFSDWDDENRAGSEDRAIDDVDAQKRAAADDMALDEDLPRVPAPGRRVDEDDLGDASLHSDDVPGRRKNTATHLALPKGNVYRGKPAGRYSAFKRESMRESGGDLMTDDLMTDWLLGELEVAAKSAHSFF